MINFPTSVTTIQFHSNFPTSAKLSNFRLSNFSFFPTALFNYRGRLNETVSKMVKWNWWNSFVFLSFGINETVSLSRSVLMKLFHLLKGIKWNCFTSSELMKPHQPFILRYVHCRTYLIGSYDRIFNCATFESIRFDRKWTYRGFISSDEVKQFQ